MFTGSAAYYDAIYSARFDFPNAAERVRALIAAHARRPVHSLLDVACGTGLFLTEFRAHFEVEGFDIEPGMIAVAREKCPGAPLHVADMMTFDLDQRFDALVCLGSAIGYARDSDGLRAAFDRFAAHTAPGGVAIVEPWFTPDVWDDGRVTADVYTIPGGKLARVLVSGLRDGMSIVDAHYLIGTADGVQSLVERHELGLFTVEEQTRAFEDAGFAVTHDPAGLTGRGLYVGVRW